jgi:hypothetical protein
VRKFLTLRCSGIVRAFYQRRAHKAVLVEAPLLQQHRKALSSAAIEAELDRFQHSSYLDSDHVQYRGPQRRGVPHTRPGELGELRGLGRDEVYRGEFQGGLRHGRGTQSYSDGDLYIGMWDRGRRHGFGSARFALRGITYQGEWSRDHATGRGTLSALDGSWHYEGEVVNALPSGTGHMRYTDDSRYVGEYQEGVRHGRGTHLKASGEVYYGEWVNDLRHGPGLVRLSEQDETISGVWRNGTLYRAARSEQQLQIPVELQQAMPRHAMDSNADLVAMAAAWSGGASATPLESFAHMPSAGLDAVGDTPSATGDLFAASKPFDLDTMGKTDTAPTLPTPQWAQRKYSKVSPRKFDAVMEERIATAVGYLHDAVDARDPRGRDGKTSLQLRAYMLHRHWLYRWSMLGLAVALMIVTAVLEPPSRYHVDVPGYAELRVPVMIGELVAVVILMLDSAVRFFHTGTVWNPARRTYQMTTWRWLRQPHLSLSALALVLQFVDLLFAFANFPYLGAMRWARVLRPVLVITHSTALHELTRLIVLTLPRILDLLGLMLVIMFVFAVVGSTLFSGLYDGSATDSFESTLRCGDCVFSS